MSQDLESSTASDRNSLCRAYVYLCTLFPKPSPSFPAIDADGQSGEEPAGFSVSSPTSSQSSSAASLPSPASPSSLESPALPNATLLPTSQDLSKVDTASATSVSVKSSPSPGLPSHPRGIYIEAISQPDLDDAFVVVQHMPQSMPSASYSRSYEGMPAVSSTSFGKRRADNTAWYPSKSRRTEGMCTPERVLFTEMPGAAYRRFPGADKTNEGHALDLANYISGAPTPMERFHKDGPALDDLQLSDRELFPSSLSQATWLTEDWAWNSIPQMSYHQFFDAIAPTSHNGQEGHYDMTETTQSMPQMFEAGFSAVPRMFEAEDSDGELEMYEGQRSLYAVQGDQYGIQQAFCGGQQGFFNETETAYDDHDSRSNSLQIFGDASEAFYPSIQSVLDGTFPNGAQENGYDALQTHQDVSQFFANIGQTSSAAEHTNGNVPQFDMPQSMQDALHPLEGIPQGIAEALPIVVPPPPNPRRNQTPYLSGEHNCHPCRLGFKARGDVARHERTAKHDRRMRQLYPNAESKLRLARCDVCGGTFANEYTVSKHKATQHVGSA